MKTIIIALALLMAAVGLVGCKDLKDKKSAPSTEPATQPAAKAAVDQDASSATGARQDKAKVEELSAANLQLAAQLEDRQKQLEALRKSLTQGDSDARETIGDMQAEIELLKGNNESLRSALDLVAAAQKGQEDAKDQLAVKLNDALKASDKLNQENQRLRDGRKGERDQLAAAYDELEKARQVIAVNNKNAQDAIARLQGENQQLAATNDALMQALDRARGSGRDSGKGSIVSQLEEARKTSARLNEENKRLADQLAAAAEQDKKQEKTIRQLTADLAQSNATIRDLQKKLTERDRPDSNLVQKLAERDKRIAELVTQVAQLDRQLKDLQRKEGDRDDSNRPPRRGADSSTPAVSPTVAPVPSSPSASPGTAVEPSPKPAPTPSSIPARRR